MSVTGPPLYENTHTDTHTLAQHHIFMLSLATDTNFPLMVDVSTVLKIVPPSMEAVVSIFKLKLLMQTKILLIFLFFFTLCCVNLLYAVSWKLGFCVALAVSWSLSSTLWELNFILTAAAQVVFKLGPVWKTFKTPVLSSPCHLSWTLSHLPGSIWPFTNWEDYWQHRRWLYKGRAAYNIGNHWRIKTDCRLKQHLCFNPSRLVYHIS